VSFGLQRGMSFSTVQPFETRLNRSRRRRGVGDVEIGGVVGWPVVKVTYRTVVRTSEYPLHPGNHHFGSIDFTVWFKRTPISRR
jgi:outer membrane protein LpxR